MSKADIYMFEWLKWNAAAIAATIIAYWIALQQGLTLLESPRTYQAHVVLALAIVLWVQAFYARHKMRMAEVQEE